MSAFVQSVDILFVFEHPNSRIANRRAVLQQFFRTGGFFVFPCAKLMSFPKNLQCFLCVTRLCRSRSHDLSVYSWALARAGVDVPRLFSSGAAAQRGIGSVGRVPFC